MTQTIRETSKFGVMKSLAGMGIRFYEIGTSRVSLWDTEVTQETLQFLITSTEDEFNIFCSETLDNYEIIS